MSLKRVLQTLRSYAERPEHYAHDPKYILSGRKGARRWHLAHPETAHKPSGLDWYSFPLDELKRVDKVETRRANRIL